MSQIHPTCTAAKDGRVVVSLGERGEMELSPQVARDFAQDLLKHAAEADTSTPEADTSMPPIAAPPARLITLDQIRARREYP